ncbi:hypothetical protein AD998_08495 [bacterium 336/3]|nr:hypothetical protein AD998_08495 [bacterium 336/3]
MNDNLEKFYEFFQQESFWFYSVIKSQLYLLKSEEDEVSTLNSPELSNFDTPYSNFLLENNITEQERLVLMLAVIPHIQPDLIDFLLMENITTLGRFQETSVANFIPSGYTILFLLAENPQDTGKSYFQNYSTIKKLVDKGYISFEKNASNISSSSLLNGKLIISDEILHLITSNEPFLPKYSEDFPATLYTTEENWDDLILPERTTFYLQDISAWMRNYNTIVQDPTFKKFTKGMKFLLHGEPGTGKSISVALFGKDFGKPVYRIDLSQVVSKWVGETSKNIGKIFDIARNKDWILFFDEGDALFGKRTENNSANDRYGNQEIAYLLQRIEDHKGIIFMATNKLPNMDKAFVRRFNVRVPFPIPDANTRYDIWCEAFKDLELGNVNFEYFAAKVDNTGASIRSFARYCKIWMLEKNMQNLDHDEVAGLLQTHLEHEGKIWSPNR